MSRLLASTFTLLLAVTALAREAPPAGLYDSYTGFAIPAEAVLPAR